MSINYGPDNRLIRCIYAVILRTRYDLRNKTLIFKYLLKIFQWKTKGDFTKTAFQY